MMNQITTKTKIIIAILITLIIGILVAILINNKLKENRPKNEKDAISNMMEYFEDADKDDNEINNIVETDNNEILENTANEQDVVKNDEPNKVENNNSSVVGKEEQESKQENSEAQNSQKAIELAKKEWAISVDSYDFNAELQSDGTYNVSVINKANRTVITIYNVNVNTGIVKE